MGTITFVSYDGESHETEIVEGQSVMQIAKDNGVPGIDADCGGECACGTCHVIVDDEWVAATGEPGPDEAEMLDLTPERQPNSRLSCQIKASAALDGMTVQVPEYQM